MARRRLVRALRTAVRRRKRTATATRATTSEVVVDAELLRGYFDAVHAATIRYVSGLRAADLDRIVDERWDPPVSLGVRLVSVVDDDLEHVGQAAYVRGLAERLGIS